MRRLLFLLAPILIGTMPVASPAAGPALEHRDCAPALARTEATCATVTVLEDRRRPDGRRLKLNLVVLPSEGPATFPALFDLEGGPGLPATKNALFYLGAGAVFRRGRDIVLLDQRGTGASAPLHCPSLSALDPFEDIFPIDLVASCAASLKGRRDLAAYGTPAAIQDLDEVRQALGQERIDLVAVSYGTTVALRYMNFFPGRVRAAILIGVAPPWTMAPKDHAHGAERSLRALFRSCRRDEACRAAFGDPERLLDRALARLSSLAGAPSPALFLERLRALLYAPATARRIPWLLSRVAAGNLEPFRAAVTSPLNRLYADGMFLSVTCSESFGLMDEAAAAAQARRTRFGDYRLRRQGVACRHWPKAPVPAGHLEPLRSDAAVLLLSGEHDPATPPYLAEQVAKALGQARHLVIPQGGHIWDGLEGAETCLDPLLIDFLDRGSSAELDANCIAGLHPPTFQTGPA